MADYTHLLYVRKFSVVSGDYELYVYGVNTTDVYHTIGEIYFRSSEDIKRIDVVELTPDNAKAKLDFWKGENTEIIPWHDKYETKFMAHGKWDKVQDIGLVDTLGRPVYHLSCPLCGFHWAFTGHAKYFKHCPGCGAKMDS